jgi:uncharacterized membrane protein
MGYFLELIYRSIKQKKLIRPLFINLQMYGLTAGFLSLIYFLDITLILRVLFILVFTTGIEFLVGYGYLKFKKIRLWNYSDQFLNYQGLICPIFSFYWLLISLFYFYLIIPLVI